MTAYPTSPRNPNRKEVEKALQDVDFPMAKDDLVGCLSGRPEDDPVLRQLRALPVATYGSVDEVLRSVDVADQRGP